MLQLPENLIDKTGDCWLWTGSRDKNGYGLMRVQGVTTRVNRIAWQVYTGEDPKHQHVLHSCDTPACIRREHLRLGTHSDNMQDMVDKGRAYRPTGEKNPKAVLTQELAGKIRQLHKDGASAKALAKLYGVARGTMYHLLAGRTWA